MEHPALKLFEDKEFTDGCLQIMRTPRVTASKINDETDIKTKDTDETFRTLSFLCDLGETYLTEGKITLSQTMSLQSKMPAIHKMAKQFEEYTNNKNTSPHIKTLTTQLEENAGFHATLVNVMKQSHGTAHQIEKKADNYVLVEKLTGQNQALAIIPKDIAQKILPKQRSLPQKLKNWLRA